MHNIPDILYSNGKVYSKIYLNEKRNFSSK